GGVVSSHRLKETVEDFIKSLQTFSPRVESDEARPGGFFLDPSGLDRIYGGPRTWATTVHRYLKARGFQNAVVIGWGRFPTFAIARTRSGPGVVRTREQMRDLASRVPLARLEISAPLLEALTKIGVHLLGDLLKLP